MEEEIIKKYDVPGLGIVELIHREGVNLPYYAKIKSQETGMGMRSIYCTGHSKTEEELKFRVGESVERILETTKSELEKQLNPVIDSLIKIGIHSVRIQALDSFEVKDEEKE